MYVGTWDWRGILIDDVAGTEPLGRCDAGWQRSQGRTRTARE